MYVTFPEIGIATAGIVRTVAAPHDEHNAANLHGVRLMPDMDPDVFLSTCELAQHLRNQHGACRSNRETITRWIVRGVKVGGKRVKLRAIRQGGKWLVRMGDYQEFVTACSARATHAEAPEIETPAQYKRRARAAREAREAIFATPLNEGRTKQTAKRAS